MKNLSCLTFILFTIFLFSCEEKQLTEEEKLDKQANEIAQKSNIKILKLPYLIIKSAAYFGDMLKFFNIGFPLTSFRLKNMTTNNIVPLTNTAKICKDLPYTRSEGIDITLKWIDKK